MYHFRSLIDSITIVSRSPACMGMDVREEEVFMPGEPWLVRMDSLA